MTWHLSVVSVVSIWVSITTVSIITSVSISVWITVSTISSISIPSIGTSISFWFSFSLSGSLFSAIISTISSVSIPSIWAGFCFWFCFSGPLFSAIISIAVSSIWITITSAVVSAVVAT